MGRRTQGIKLIVIYIKIQAGANIESCPAYTFVKNRGVFTAPSLSYTFTPVYNFINGRRAGKPVVLKPLS